MREVSSITNRHHLEQNVEISISCFWPTALICGYNIIQMNKIVIIIRCQQTGWGIHRCAACTSASILNHKIYVRRLRIPLGKFSFSNFSKENREILAHNGEASVKFLEISKVQVMKTSKQYFNHTPMILKHVIVHKTIQKYSQ